MLELLLVAQLVGFNPHPKPLDKKFILLSAATIASAVLDVEATRGCINRVTCREGNPFMRPFINSRWKVYSVQALGTGAVLTVSYKLKARGIKSWWVAPAIVTTGHTVFAGLAFRF